MSAGLRRTLVALDLSPLSDRVVGRVAQLPLAPDARVTLLHVVPGGLPVGAQRRAERDGSRGLADQARSLAKSLRRGMTVEPVLVVGNPAAAIASHAGSTRAELIIMGRGGSRAMRDVFLGSTAERVIRRGKRPVLAVRLPSRAPYRRPVLALDLDRAAEEVLSFLLRVLPQPPPRVTIVHAFDVPYSGLVYPSLSMEDADDYRDSYRRKAERRIERVVVAAMARAGVPAGSIPPSRMVVRHGSPRMTVSAEVRKADADLLALGTHGHAGLTQVFLGTVAGDLLRSVPSDVLVVPPRA